MSAESKQAPKKPKFSVGQVVRIHTDWYATARKEQQYQRITAVWPWRVGRKTVPRWGYTFLNGDKANEKYVRPLTAKESGR
jgi:hypothetical protein